MRHYIILLLYCMCVHAQVAFQFNNVKNVTICTADTTVYVEDNANSIFVITKAGPGNFLKCGDTVTVQLVGTDTHQTIVCTEGAAYTYITDTGMGINIDVLYCSSAGSDCITTSPVYTSHRAQSYSEFTVLATETCLPAWLYPATSLPPPAAAIRTSNSHACILDTHGTVYCWGSNDRCQTGVGIQGQPVRSPTRVPYATNVLFLKIAPDGTTCAQLKTYDIICWGKDAAPNEPCVRSTRSKMALAISTTWNTECFYFPISGGIVLATINTGTWITSGATARNTYTLANIGTFSGYDTSIVGIEWTRYPVYQFTTNQAGIAIFQGATDVFTQTQQIGLYGLTTSAYAQYDAFTCSPLYVTAELVVLCNEATQCEDNTITTNSSGYIACGNQHGTVGNMATYPRAIEMAVSGDVICRIMLDRAIYCTGSMTTCIVQYYGAHQAIPISTNTVSAKINEIGEYQISTTCNATLSTLGCGANLTITCADASTFDIPAAGIRSAYQIDDNTCIVTDICANSQPWYSQIAGYTPINQIADIAASAASFCILAVNGTVICSGQTATCAYILPVGGIDIASINQVYQPWRVSKIVSARTTTCFVDTTATRIMCSGNVNGYYTWCSRQTVMQYTTTAPIAGVFLADTGMICITTASLSGGIILQCLWNGYSPSLGSSTTNAGFQPAINIPNMTSDARILFDHTDGNIALQDDTTLCTISQLQVQCSTHTTTHNSSYLQNGYVYSPSPYKLISDATSVYVGNKTSIQSSITWYAYGSGDIVRMSRQADGSLFLLQSGEVVCDQIATCGRTQQTNASYTLVGTWTPIVPIPNNSNRPPSKRGLASARIDQKVMFAILFIVSIVIVAIAISAYFIVPRRHLHGERVEELAKEHQHRQK